MYARSSERYPFLDPPVGRRRSAQPPHESWPWASSDVAGRSIGGICAIPGRRKPTAGKGKSSTPLTRRFPIFTSNLSPPTQAPKLAQPLPDLSLSLWRPPASRRPPTHPATRMMTRRGSPATVIKKSAKAGPKATKVHPKNTAAPMAGQQGAEWKAWPRGVDGGRKPAGESAWGGDATP